jgi:hypothetical protein
MNDDHALRGRSRLNAAKNNRSTVVNGGRFVCRRKIASSCRSTTISSAFTASERQRQTATRNTRRTRT